MAQINEHYQKLKAGYLFPEIGRRIREYISAHPGSHVIRMGIGDVTRPLVPSVIKAFHEGVEEMAHAGSFKGYGPEQGYPFLREAIAREAYRSRGAGISADDIFISDGSKCDTGNIQEIFSTASKTAVCDPVYPVYADTTVMAGKTGRMKSNGYYNGIIYMPCTAGNRFLPDLPPETPDLIFLCFPNNPTGAVASREELKKWVDYATAHRSIILFDAAYEAFITDDTIPHSIYEIEGADKVAIEFRSLSKTAGFTGTRLAYTVVPSAVTAFDSEGREVRVRDLWYRRQTTKFNGVSYPVQRAAAAVFTPEGARETREVIAGYLENARIIRESLSACGYTVYGGVHAPYIWVETPGGMKSWDYFDLLLHKAEVAGTPGSGFGPSGEGFFRFSAFAARQEVDEAMARIRRL